VAGFLFIMPYPQVWLLNTLLLTLDLMWLSAGIFFTSTLSAQNAASPIHFIDTNDPFQRF